ncbi:hypothetical protein MMC07_005469 [Pseudocyphellaria aurata]|nr:hypothetical protein [Pseudocyphellaria aurata]
MHIYRATFLTLLLSHHIHAIEVAPLSNCSALCDDNAIDDPGNGDSSHTTSNDLVCNDDEFTSTVAGRKFKECLTCELNSTVVAYEVANETDAYWLIYNLKFNVAWCVFGYPTNSQITESNSQCADVCGGSGNNAKASFVDRLLKFDVGLQYQYCKNGDGAFSKIADDCMKCLNEVPKATTLANFINALKVACDQRPRPGETLKLNFDVFAAASTPNSSTSTASSAGTVTVTASAAASEAASAAASADNSVRVSVGVGVGVGSGAALVLAVTAVILFRRRSKHNREVIEGEARVRREAERLAAHGVPNSNHQPRREQNVRVPELIAPDYSAGVAEFRAPDCWAGVGELSAPEYSAEADGRRLDPELEVKVPR